MQAILFFDLLKISSSEECPEGSVLVNPFPLVPNCCKNEKSFIGSFCPTSTGSYKIGLTISWNAASVGTVVVPTSHTLSMTIDGQTYSGSHSTYAGIGGYGKKLVLGTYAVTAGKCYPINVYTNAGHGVGITVNFFADGASYHFCGSNSEDCEATPYGSPKRITSSCDKFTTIYCNGQDPNGGISIEEGKETCRCSNDDVEHDIFCEENEYKPFGSNSQKLNVNIFTNGIKISADTYTFDSPSESVIAGLNDIYSTVNYTGYVYLPQIGNYKFTCKSRLPAIILIDDSEFDFSSFYLANFLNCDPEGEEKTWNEISMETTESRKVVKITVTVYTQCSLTLDSNIEILWQYQRKQYLQQSYSTNYVYEALPARYLSNTDTLA